MKKWISAILTSILLFVTCTVCCSSKNYNGEVREPLYTVYTETGVFEHLAYQSSSYSHAWFKKSNGKRIDFYGSFVIEEE